MNKSARAREEPTEFDVWGCRGSRSLVPHRSAIGNYTSCYSLLHGEDLFVFDAGRGLAALGYALEKQPRFGRVGRVHLLISHAHLDHWEGIKDANWFWNKHNGLEVDILGTAQTLKAIHTGYSHPLYVALELLARGTVRSVGYHTIRASERRLIDGWSLETAPLFHYSGEGRSYRRLDAIGYRLTAPDGATASYLCDHEPRASTRPAERALLRQSHLAVYDAHFPDVRDHMHGHGSQEHAARMARTHPLTLVLAGHHGPSFTDRQIRSAHERHGHRTPNFLLAQEGSTFRFDPARGAFTKRRAGRA
jgi:phosphoribosyl 1,2-cyclic phosphodiesterase